MPKLAGQTTKTNILFSPKVQKSLFQAQYNKDWGWFEQYLCHGKFRLRMRYGLFALSSSLLPICSFIFYELREIKRQALEFTVKVCGKF